MHFKRQLPFTLLGLMIWNSGTAAPGVPPANLLGGEWELCGEPGSGHTTQALSDSNDQATYLDADESEILRNEIFNFRGNVLVQRADQQLEADTLSYDKPKDTVDAQGNVRYRKDDLTLEGKSAVIQLENSTGHVDDVQYRIASRHARGDASRIILEGNNQTRIKRARYTTCNPGNDDWYLESDDIKLDQTKAVGTARNVWIEFKGVPIFYTPYISFPLNDERKSGFLTPSFASSEETGAEVRVPYYFNIAPGRDATLTSRLTAKRNLQLIGEFRYLNPANAGEVNIGYLPHDPLFEDDRLFFSLRHRTSFGPRWSGVVDYNYVSDDQYFKELGTSLSVASTTFLDRRAELNYRGDFWSATGRLQGFQTVDEALPGSQRPYQRLPQLLLNANLPNQLFGSTYSFNGEYVNFERQDTVTGQRVDIQPGLSLPISNVSGFVIPALSLRHTQYSLVDEPPGSDSNASRTLPIFSLDGGAFFERNTSVFSKQLVQTLEPRLFYLYVPFDDQSDLPVFDTGLLDFNFTRLFQTNRFNGADRLGDANQLTIALTSRLLDSETGVERLNLRVGQIRYFRDRKVTLPLQPVETDNSSDIILEADTAQLVKNWSANTTLLYNPHESRIDRGVFGIRYQPDQHRYLDLSYRYRDDDFEPNFISLRRELLHQTDVIALWPISQKADRHINGVARWNYSLQADRTLEFLLGVEYDTCCYAFRIAGRRFVNDIGGDSNNGIFVQLELKGLTSFGGRGRKGLEGFLETRPGDRGYSNLGYQGTR
ncbi:MAG: LPS assembly protein LptD [Gammaproteobacteria bacterium]